MNIRFNSQSISLTEAVSLLVFLQTQLNDCDAVLARSVVAVNQQLVPSNQYADYVLQDSDDIELLTAMVGG
jgi:thiamine biosynthesis protein ThiS